MCVVIFFGASDLLFFFNGLNPRCGIFSFHEDIVPRCHTIPAAKSTWALLPEIDVTIFVETDAGSPLFLIVLSRRSPDWIFVM